MTAEEVRKELIEGITKVLSLGPVLGPSRKQRAVLEASRLALLADPGMAEEIARYVAVAEAEGPGGCSPG